MDIDHKEASFANRGNGSMRLNDPRNFNETARLLLNEKTSRFWDKPLGLSSKAVQAKGTCEFKDGLMAY
jgi:hypothetical protein